MWTLSINAHNLWSAVLFYFIALITNVWNRSFATLVGAAVKRLPEKVCACLILSPVFELLSRLDT